MHVEILVLCISCNVCGWRISNFYYSFHTLCTQINSIFLPGNAVQSLTYHKHILLYIYTSLFLSPTIRLQLAALHFNENANRKQAVIKEVGDRYNIMFPKYKKGGHIVRKVVQDPTYGRLLYTIHSVMNNSMLLIAVGYTDELIKETVSKGGSTPSSITSQKSQ